MTKASRTGTIAAILVVAIGLWLFVGGDLLDGGAEVGTGNRRAASAAVRTEEGGRDEGVKAPSSRLAQPDAEEGGRTEAAEPTVVAGKEAAEVSHDRETKVVEGVVRLSCGLPFADRRLVVAEAELRRYEALDPEEAGRGAFAFVTDDAGEFRVEVPEELDEVRFWLEQDFYLEQLDRVDVLDGEPVELVYRASVVDARVVDRTGAEKVGARVALRVEEPRSGGPMISTLRGTTREGGWVRFLLTRHGEARLTVVAPEHDSFASLDFTLPVATGHIERTIVLDRSASLGSLRIEVVDRATGLPTPFQAWVIERDSGIRATQLDSEELPPDGFVFGLPLGEYEVKLRNRYRKPPSLYDLDDIREVDVTLTADRTEHVRFEVDVRARAFVDLSSFSKREAVRLEARPAEKTGESDWIELDELTVLDEDGNTTEIDFVAQVGKRYLTPPLATGVYELRLTRDRTGEEVAREVVELHPSVLPVVSLVER